MPSLPAEPVYVLVHATGIIGSFLTPTTGLSLGIHADQNLAQHQRFAVRGQGKSHRVDVGGAIDVAVPDATQDRMVLHAGSRKAPRAFDGMISVMVDPGLTEHLPAETAIPRLALPGIAGISRILGQLERVRRGAQAR